MDVSVIIINYKTFALTSQCVDSILKFTKGVSLEIILVENGTSEFTIENISPVSYTHLDVYKRQG